MEKQTESNFRTFAPVFMAMVFTILQAFTVYFTKNVETSISRLDAKLDQTWETALITKTELASLKVQVETKSEDITQLEKELRDNRVLILGHISDTMNHNEL